MRDRILEHKQQIKLFIKELIGFAILFALLGMIVYFFFQKSIYSNIDAGLNRQRLRIERNVASTQEPLQVNPRPGAFNPFNNYSNGDFQTNIIVFNKKGIISNRGMLGQRTYQLLSKLTVDSSKLNKIDQITLGSKNYVTNFRGVLLKVSKDNLNTEYAGNYVLILQNIDAELLALHSFIEALIVTLIFFWIIAILIAYYLSKSSMKPIINSWHRQKEFSSNAAHELRTPLTVIQNQMEYLLTKPTDRIVDQIQPVSTTLDEVKHLKVLTQRLLTLARSDSNIVQAQRQSIDLAPFFSSMVAPFNEIANSQNKSFISNVDAEGTGRIDPDLIKQLMVILIDNAMKYTPQGGTVAVRINRTHNALKLMVSDTGNGILDEDKQLIFERFYRTDKSRNSKTGGNGLGLSIAKWIVDQHHGRITVRDNHPTGTIFTVTFNL
ncbi:sensor histidine kinase [Apilactobacillus apinorum]|uniref:sensor histidine kinase n=1 Tax=Apilactobacillus apinorum TaxID=1218495 RepID=UPI0006B5F746|nr:HAMP domain-containing sensor histidine kinase [Apilactobacillus apinorum]KOY69919.1 Integral membrane sensor signal transduction histidine kinase [Apilactobacillus apinorum]CAI2609595.1 Integral membrane sensor signal transduction histidine kinase [Apilactobacillus apinorum]